MAWWFKGPACDAHHACPPPSNPAASLGQGLAHLLGHLRRHLHRLCLRVGLEARFVLHRLVSAALGRGGGSRLGTGSFHGRPLA
eukprot:526561-Alexandrium_andersonii.AAC.1